MMSNGTSPAEPEMPKIGDYLAHYRLTRKVAVGGYGTVYEAFEESLNRRVAVKVLAPHLAADQSFAERFCREARILAGLVHPNITQIFYIGNQDGRIFFAMELVDGFNLETLLREHGQFTMSEACQFIRQAALGLQHAHNHGVIHRDVKPGNLLATRDGVVKVTDFGLATDVHSMAGDAGGEYFVGTPDYVSPEEAAGLIVDHRSDIYSLGATLYHFIAGRSPYQGTPEEILRQHVESTPPRIQQFNIKAPPRLNPILDKMMARDRDARYQNYADLLADLDRLLAMRTLPKSKSQVKTPPKKGGVLRRVVAGACMAAVAGLIVFLVVKQVVKNSGNDVPEDSAAVVTGPTSEQIEQEAAVLWEDLRAQAEVKLQANDLGGAMTIFDAWPVDKYKNTHPHSLWESQRRTALLQARNAWRALDQRASRMAEDNQFDDAVALYETVKTTHTGMAEFEQNARERIELMRQRKARHEAELAAAEKVAERERRDRFHTQVAVLEPLVQSLQFEKAVLDCYTLSQQMEPQYQDLLSNYQHELQMLAGLKRAVIEQTPRSPPAEFTLTIGSVKLTGQLVAANRLELRLRHVLGSGGSAETVVAWTDLAPEDAVRIFRSHAPATDMNALLAIGVLLSRYAARGRVPVAVAQQWFDQLANAAPERAEEIGAYKARADEWMTARTLSPPQP